MKQQEQGKFNFPLDPLRLLDSICPSAALQKGILLDGQFAAKAVVQQWAIGPAAFSSACNVEP